jgi:undecaprenyl-diphosphatase
VNWFAWLAIAIVAIIAAAFLFDEASIGWAASLPDRAGSLFQAITVAGKSDWYLIPTGVLLILLAFGSWRRIEPAMRAAWAEIAALAGYAFLSVAAAAIAVNLMKQIIGRSRPAVFVQDGWLAFDPFNFDYANASFPSGHATTAGAAIVAGALIFPKLRVPIVAVGLLIASSRVMVGAHYPSDTIAGLALGGGIAYLIARFLRRRGLAFHVDESGRTRPSSRAACAARKRSWPRLLAAPFRALAALPG